MVPPQPSSARQVALRRETVADGRTLRALHEIRYAKIDFAADHRQQAGKFASCTGGIGDTEHWAADRVAGFARIIAQG